MKKLMLMGALALMAGCTAQLGKFTVYSPQPLDLSKGGAYYVDRTQKVHGVDPCTMYLLFADPDAPQYDVAVRKAMAKRPGCVGLADCKLYREAFWLLFGYCDFHAEGYPIMKKEVSKPAPAKKPATAKKPKTAKKGVK